MELPTSLVSCLDDGIHISNRKSILMKGCIPNGNFPKNKMDTFPLGASPGDSDDDRTLKKKLAIQKEFL
jgi:hypothetical protein